HLFAYRDRWTDLIGFVLFIVSDIFDSADGQLARLRGTSTRFGRALDGIGDNVRFINLYFHLLYRLIRGGWWWPGAVLLVAFAGLAHTFQSAAVDFVRNAFLRIGVGDRGELDLPEDLERPASGTLLPLCSWLGQNIRFVLLGVAGLSGHIAAYLWAVAGPMSLLLVLLVLLHEWNATALADILDSQRDAYAPVS